MQDLESIAGSVRAQLFGVGGGGAAVDGRLRAQQQHQSVNCPRCDSLNTKFCYYNNYNLSQPRHFCKSCRRYWTKGGILRNVPVGGGSRKSKRSEKGSAAAPAKAPRQSKDHRRRAPSAPSGSSSDSSTLTAGTATEASPPAQNQTVGSVAESTDRGAPTSTASAAEIFHDADDPILSGLVESRGFIGCNFTDTISFQLPAQQKQQQQQQAGGENGSAAEEIKLQEEFTMASFMEQVAPSDLPPVQSNRIEVCGGLAELTWPGCYDPTTAGMYDLLGGTMAGGADNGVFWNQNHWAETDPSLYLP